MTKHKYTVGKARGLWWVLDEEGYEVRSVGYDFKYEALEAAKVCAEDDAERKYRTGDGKIFTTLEAATDHANRTAANRGIILGIEVL